MDEDLYNIPELSPEELELAKKQAQEDISKDEDFSHISEDRGPSEET